MGRIATVVWMMTAVLAVPAAAVAADPPDRADKRAVIDLIEQRLASAWTIRTPDDSPAFGVLDAVFPAWHGGDPAGARRKWTFHGYERYRPVYSVRSVHLKMPGLATAKGKRTVTVHRRVKFYFFPSELKKERRQGGFTIDCRKTPPGDWEIIRAVYE